MLPGLTEEQNKKLKRMHVDSVNCVEVDKKLADKGNQFAGKLAYYHFAQAQAYLELGDFECDPRFTDYVGKL